MKRHPLVCQDHIKVKAISKSSTMSVLVISVVLSKYELNPSISENVITIKAKLKTMTLSVKVV